MKTSKYGLVMGFVMIMTALLFHISSGDQTIQMIEIKSLVILGIIPIIQAMLLNRLRKENKNILLFDKAFRASVLCAVTGGLIYCTYYFVFLKYIDTEYISRILSFSMKRLADHDQPDSIRNDLGATMNFMSKPVLQALNMMLNVILTGTFFSLILSAIFRRHKNIENIKASGNPY